MPAFLARSFWEGVRVLYGFAALVTVLIGGSVYQWATDAPRGRAWIGIGVVTLLCYWLIGAVRLGQTAAKEAASLRLQLDQESGAWDRAP